MYLFGNDSLAGQYGGHGSYNQNAGRLAGYPAVIPGGIQQQVPFGSSYGSTHGGSYQGSYQGPYQGPYQSTHQVPFGVQVVSGAQIPAGGYGHGAPGGIGGIHG
ncbi:hypothetical protein QAD02_001520 [Eretmocerus hayati]|uniref:Uncharacterized protein n=1 Tax=Eretmocerus hayati TaxID=131215 RepID=A0ACC2NH60_9HYME|nr:hypothetical protein QAD02_001520 [Eretmocerus hayati]